MVAGALAALVAAGAIVVLVRPVLGPRMPWAALVVAVASAILTVAAGRALDAGSLEFLIGVSVFALPVLVLLEAAAIASGAMGAWRWLVILGWGLIVFPLTFLVPVLATSACLAPECGFEDFAGALPLVVSSGAYMVLAWLPAAGRRSDVARLSSRRTVIAVGVLWLASVAWLMHLEGMVDEYTPRIAFAGVVVPVASAVGWLAVDRLRNVPRSAGRSVLLGLAAGIVVAWPGAVSVGMPWFPIAGLLAGAAAALVFSALRAVAPAPRWGLTVLAAVGVGFIAPAISGDTVGIIFAARVAVLAAPLLALTGVSAFSVAVSAPIWMLVRRRPAGESR